ncbi:MAG: hypothetical protein U0Q11_23510 [Vicinamibacterales bacterium]
MQTIPPLGPGSPIALSVPGAQALAPALVAQSPFVAVAFGTNDSRGAMVYLATSSDNGATFDASQPVSDEAGSAPALIRLSLSEDSSDGDSVPAVRIAWHAAGGKTSERVIRPWHKKPASTTGRQASTLTRAMAACTDQGEVVLTDEHRDGAQVSVNHGLAEQTCASRAPSALNDARHWAHVAWIAGADEAAARVLYAASSDRAWFGGAQPLVESGQRPAHLTLVTDPNDTVVATWDGDAAMARHVFLRQILPAHHGPATMLPMTRLSGDAGGVEPVTASITGGVIVAWREPLSGSIVLRRVGLDAICETAPAAPAKAAGSLASAR